MGSLNWASGLIPLGRLYLRPLYRHFLSLGLTDWFTPLRQSDPLVLATFCGTGRTHVFLPQESKSARFMRISRFLWTPPRRGRALTWGFPDFGYLDPYRPQAPHQLFVAQGGGLVVCALQHWAPMLQCHHVMIATDNSTVVSYINKQGGTHSPTLLRLTVELLLWLDMLEAQNIIVRARHTPGCLNLIADHLSRPNQPISTEWSLHPESVKRIFRVCGMPEVDMFATVSNSHLPRFMSPIPEPRARNSRGNSHSPLVAELVVVSTPTSSLCGTPSRLSLPSGSSVLAGPEVCLRRKVVPSARMEALIRHYEAEGFSDEVSRLTAAPRRP